MSATDTAIATHAANRATALQRLEETEARIAEVKQQISAAEFDVGRAAELIAGGKFEIPQAPDVSGLRAELSRLESAAAALRLGLEKIEAAIAERDSELDRKFIGHIKEMQAGSVAAQFDAMLTLAELAQEDVSLKKETPDHLAVHIAAVHSPFWRAVGFAPTGTRATAREYLEELAKEYGARCGFQMTNKQASRIAALAI
jgi:hypothetical protein